MKRADFRFDLPEALIAQHPLAERTASRLLALDGRTGALTDRVFGELPALLTPRDLLVFNDTRVIPARLLGRKRSGGRVEVMVERLNADGSFWALIKASKAPRPGAVLALGGGGALSAAVLHRQDDLFLIRAADPELRTAARMLDCLERYGRLPLPPYIKRDPHHTDRERYQTVYAREPGAVAAPTAGLHFTDALLQTLERAGVRKAFVTLHVGAGTFQPVRVDRVRDHVMHAEFARVPAATVEAIARTRAQGGRVIAVGTTTVRSLETAARTGGALLPYAGLTDIFIYPGFEFKVVDAMVTNFHLPESTLLMLVSAFAGREAVLAAYRHAVAQRYRFFSYGDAMFLTRKAVNGAL